MANDPHIFQIDIAQIQFSHRTSRHPGKDVHHAVPERNLTRNWGQSATPYAAFIAAYLLKLNEGKKSLSDLRVSLLEHPELIWLLGFPLLVSYPAKLGFDADASLPTARHLSRLLREMPNSVLQFLLDASVRVGPVI